MKFSIIFICTLFTLNATTLVAYQSQDYWKYHEEINKAEKLIGNHQFQEALDVYNKTFNDYDFVFLRDYKIAAQLAFYLDQHGKGMQLLKKGIAAGWDIKGIKKHSFLSKFLSKPELQSLQAAFPVLHKNYTERIDTSARIDVYRMFKKDQKMALGAFIRIRKKAKAKYALHKFAPHSEIQLSTVIDLLEQVGYPGEQLIGNDYWMSTILSHHNSIDPSYVKNDTLYRFIKPKLFEAIGSGQISPYEFVLIDDWQITVASDRTQPGYGFLDAASRSTLNQTNELRRKIGLRTVELRNRLVEVEKQTGMNFHLPNWIDGKIQIEEK